MLTDVLGANIIPGATTPDELAGLNPIFVGKAGDPADIGPVVAACIDGSTLYPSGTYMLLYIYIVWICSRECYLSLLHILPLIADC